MKHEELVYREIIHHRGPKNQILKACEEMGELMQALSKYQIYKSQERKMDVYHEIVDVFIVLEQLCLIHNFPKDIFLRIKKEKIGKIEHVIKGFKANEKASIKRRADKNNK